MILFKTSKKNFGQAKRKEIPSQEESMPKGHEIRK
jgi:hypothetical protein